MTTRFNNSVEVIDLATGVTEAILPLHNPEPEALVEGRPLLYDAVATSGNGEASCSSCHIFGDFEAHLIQREVVRFMEDAGRLRDRVLDLQRHFGLANADIEKILTSSDRIASRGRKIENLEFEDEAPSQVEGDPAPSPASSPAPSPLPGPRAKPRVTRRNGGSRQPDLLARE